MGTLFLFLFIVAPLSITFHELGHAFGAYHVHSDRILFSIGTGKPIFSLHGGRFRVLVHTLFFIGGHTLHEREHTYTKRELCLISVTGPIFNIVFGLICLLIDLEIFYIAFLFNVWLASINIIPFKIGEKKSDGYVCLELFKKKNLHKDKKPL